MVAIKDFGMPSCCENCDMCVPDYSDDRGLYYCVITEEPCKEYQDNRQLSCPLVEIEPLTDTEQRIFLSAISREEQVCGKIDNDKAKQ